MNTRTKLATVVAVVAATVMMMAPAGATSLSRVYSMTTALGDDMSAIGEAAGDEDTVALADACQAMEDHTDTALRFRRPAAMPRAAWRHTRLAWSLMNEAAPLCIDGAENYDPDSLNASTALMSEATDEIDLATDAMS